MGNEIQKMSEMVPDIKTILGSISEISYSLRQILVFNCSDQKLSLFLNTILDRGLHLVQYHTNLIGIVTI